MATATCPKCRTKFSPVDGQPIICPGCGATFKSAKKREPAAVTAGDGEDTMPPSYSRESMPELEAPEPMAVAPPIQPIRPEPSPAAAPTPFPEVATRYVPQPVTLNQSGPSSLQIALLLVRGLMWGSCIAVVALCILNYITVQQNAKDMSAIQQAALGVDTCVWVIAAYVICRGIDSATRL